ncbi:WYL domain-containing protein [Ideonella sp. BN130291]|uniref:WYL domain-containing protein n=1 Tax=Ideonella sp. BN130291 TaxID=3112940 RepID=UPI002E253EF6|nr:WYL domain-containing protein [Ideonella sp. BN130291]
MNQDLVKAIEQKRRLRFTYNGRTRLVEPQCYGVGIKATELLRAHQLTGGTEREPLFDVSKMSQLQVLEETFPRPGPNYRRNDSAMARIFAQL